VAAPTQENAARAAPMVMKTGSGFTTSMINGIAVTN
jgi:hypothetical protein